MAFIVMYERNDGSLAAESCQDLDAAVMAAERLRNSDSIEHPRIFETTEVEYEFQTYFRVQVVGAAASGDSADGTESAPFGAEASESSEEADIDWPSFESSDSDASDDQATDDSDADDEVSEAEAGAYGIGVGEIDSPVADSPADADADGTDVEDTAVAELDTDADAEDDSGEAEVTDTIVAEDDDTYVSDLDVLDVDDAEGVADDAGSEEKVGLFDKFVKTLEGEAEDTAGQVDDLSGNDTSRRGLFGR